MSQMVNHFEGHSEISTKNNFLKNVRVWHEERGENVFRETTPLTFNIKVPTLAGEVDVNHLRQELKTFK